MPVNEGFANFVYAASAILVIVASMTGYWASQARDKVANDRRLGNETKTAVALQAAAEANKGQEQIRRENLELSLKLEEMHRDRLAIQAALAPRVLVAEHPRVDDLFRPHGRVKVTIRTLEDDVEASALASQLDELFTGVGWEVEFPIKYETYLPNGVYVAIRDSTVHKGLENAADDLIDFCQANGVVAQRGGFDWRDRDKELPFPDVSICVSVGRKPQDYFDDLRRTPEEVARRKADAAAAEQQRQDARLSRKNQLEAANLPESGNNDSEPGGSTITLEAARKGWRERTMAAAKAKVQLDLDEALKTTADPARRSALESAAKTLVEAMEQAQLNLEIARGGSGPGGAMIVWPYDHNGRDARKR